MTLFLTLAVTFGLLAIHKQTRYVYAILCGLNVFLLIITTLCDKNGDTLYWLRMIAAFIVGSLMVRRNDTLGYYQAFIQVAIMCSYAALSFDVSQGKHVLIYNNYETVIYGLIICQFIGVHKSIRAFNYDCFKRDILGFLHIQRDKRT